MATSSAASAPAHRNAHVGPGSGDEPGERARVDARPQCAAQLGGEADGGGLQVVAERQGELARVAARDGLQHRLDGPGGGQRAAAEPVQLAEHRGRGRPVRCSAITQCWVWRDEHRHDLLAAAGAERGAAVQRERDVAAQLGGEAGQLVAGQVELPQRGQAHQRGRRVGAPAGHAARDRDALAQDERDVGIPVGALGEQLDRAPGEVGLVGGHLRDPFAVHRDARARG